jgi:hypothetical protein
MAAGVMPIDASIFSLPAFGAEVIQCSRRARLCGCQRSRLKVAGNKSARAAMVASAVNLEQRSVMCVDIRSEIDVIGVEIVGPRRCRLRTLRQTTVAGSFLRLVSPNRGQAGVKR